MDKDRLTVALDHQSSEKTLTINVNTVLMSLEKPNCGMLRLSLTGQCFYLCSAEKNALKQLHVWLRP